MKRHCMIAAFTLGVGLETIPLLLPPAACLFVNATMLTSLAMALFLARCLKGNRL